MRIVAGSSSEGDRDSGRSPSGPSYVNPEAARPEVGPYPQTSLATGRPDSSAGLMRPVPHQSFNARRYFKLSGMHRSGVGVSSSI